MADLPQPLLAELLKNRANRTPRQYRWLAGVQRTPRRAVDARMKFEWASRHSLTPGAYGIVCCRWCGWRATISWELPDHDVAGDARDGQHVRLHQGFQWDHFMPLALGGAHVVDNIEPICPRCNARKAAKHPTDFERELLAGLR